MFSKQQLEDDGGGVVHSCFLSIFYVVPYTATESPLITDLTNKKQYLEKIYFNTIWLNVSMTTGMVLNSTIYFCTYTWTT